MKASICVLSDRVWCGETRALKNDELRLSAVQVVEHGIAAPKVPIGGCVQGVQSVFCRVWVVHLC